MTSTWRRKVAEKSRQQLGLTLDRTFKPTPNTRLQATFAETKKFADALRKFDKQIHLHMKSIKDTFTSTHAFLASPVPRMHTEETPGQPVPVEGESIVGDRVDFERLMSSAEKGTENVKSYVLEPLHMWLNNYDTVVVNMAQVEQLRLLLDSRRRSVANLEGKVTNIRAKVQDDQDPKLGKCIEKKHHQHIKMGRVQEDFINKEQTAYANLQHLVHDIKFVQQHMHKLFELKKEIYTDACEAFPAAPPLALTSGHTGSTQHWAEGGAYPYSDGVPAQGVSGSNDSGAVSGGFRAPEAHAYSGHGTGGIAGNRVDGFGQALARKPDRYGGAINESGGYNPV